MTAAPPQPRSLEGDGPDPQRPAPVLPALPPHIRVVRGEPALALPIARRLVSQANPDIDDAARRLVASAPAHNISLANTFATVDHDGPPAVSAPGLPVISGAAPGAGSLRVRQTCLAVLGAGRTAMMFISEPLRVGDWGGSELAFAERVHVVNACCDMLAREHANEVALAQALPDPDERYATRVFDAAGFRSVGTLKYMRRLPKPHDKKLSLGNDLSQYDKFPQGVHVQSLSQIAPHLRDEHCIRAMDASYESTLDCPELCGLRETRDILASHKSTGQHDPNLWWIIYYNNEPLGCALFSPCAEQRTCELVYLGLGPPLRGKGLARLLLGHGIAETNRINSVWSMSCAVDERNAPALKLYESMHFRAFARRRALVRRLHA
ncbi:MAG: GNAT family N-acetyltransferase [Phycisphaerae bacterium]